MVIHDCISLNLSQDNAVIGVIIMKRNSMYDIRNLEISPKKCKIKDLSKLL